MPNATRNKFTLCTLYGSSYTKYDKQKAMTYINEKQ